MVKFKVILLPKDLFQTLDEMDDPNMASKQANLRLFQQKSGPNKNPLGCDFDNLKVSWNKIKKAEISIGHKVYKPFQNVKMLAKVEKPEFMDFEKELFPADVTIVVNDLLLDIKLAKEGL